MGRGSVFHVHEEIGDPQLGGGHHDTGSIIVIDRLVITYTPITVKWFALTPSIICSFFCLPESIQSLSNSFAKFFSNQFNGDGEELVIVKRDKIVDFGFSALSVSI